MSVYIYDVETLSNLFTYSAVKRDSDEIISFVIWEKKNEFLDLINHLESVKGHIGFNNISFDSNIIDYILYNERKFSKYSGEKIAKLIYAKSQEVIGKEWSMNFNPLIPELDLFKIHHLDNKAKMTGLKKLEIAMQFPNVQDMPYKHTDIITSDEQVKEILDYNINDILATKAFYELSKDKIELRKGLISKYGISCLNYSDSKIGEEMMLSLYCKKTNSNKREIKKSKTYRNNIKFSDCIPSYVKFETEEFKNLLSYLREIEVKELNSSFTYELNYGGIDFFYGTGGLHASIKEGIYEPNENELMIDADVNNELAS